MNRFRTIMRAALVLLLMAIPITQANAVVIVQHARILAPAAVYCEGTAVNGYTYLEIDRLLYAAYNTFGQIKGKLPQPSETFGYKFLQYSHNEIGDEASRWNDDDLMRDFAGTDPQGEHMTPIFYTYEMVPTLVYETNGADNANDPAFDSYEAPDNSDTPVVNIPTVKPVRANSEPGRSGDTFTGWYKDALVKETVPEGQGLKALWIEQGEPLVSLPSPCVRDVKQAKVYAGWDEAPLVVGQDMTIVAGDTFDPASLVDSATDKEDGTPEVTFTGDYDVNTPGVYPITITATDTAGGTHQVTVNLTVLTRIMVLNKAPVLEVADVKIVTGGAFSASDVVVSATDTEDDAAGVALTTTYSGEFDVNTAGTYPITVTVTDSQGASTTKTANLVVLPPLTVMNEAPVLEVADVKIVAGGAFSASDVVVSATDTEDDAAGVALTTTYSGEFDVNTAGTYPITVTVTDSQGASTTKTANLVVLPPLTVTNEAPVLKVADVKIVAGGAFSASDVVVSATDTEDDAAGVALTTTYSGEFDVNTAGTYPITVTVTDSQGASTTKTANLVVTKAADPVDPVDPVKPADPDKPAAPSAPAAPSVTPKLPSTGSSAQPMGMLAMVLALLGAGALATRRKLS